MSKQFRDYTNVNDSVKENYMEARKKQTVLHYQTMVSEFNKRPKISCNFWDVMEKLNSFVDLSDPDMSLPNIHHMFQSAEEARKQNEPRWFQLVCLIHDLGKIQAYIDNNDEKGVSMRKQWSLVGDTFILGCKIPNTIVFPEFNHLNSDPEKKNIYGLYKPGCGLNDTLISWGHDEFLYRVLLDNNHSLPEEALYIIRFHSLYLWHTENEYFYFENEKDKEMKNWVKKFNKYDLYTKCDKSIDVDELRSYYSELFIEFFGSLNIII